MRRFRYLFLRGNPQSYARMNKPNAHSKYTKILDPGSRVPLVITDVAIAQHLAGTATYAAPLIGADGFAREAALDIDQGGEVAVQCALHITNALGYSAYALVSPAVTGGHNGGHIHIPFCDVAAPVRARLLAEHIKQLVVAECSLPANAIEVYPTLKGLRLPFGVHTYSGRRGVLLLQDGTRLELDEGEQLAIIAQALSLLEALIANEPDRLPQIPPMTVSTAPGSPPNALQRSNSGSPIQDYTRQTNLLDWLVSIGARIAAPTRVGGYLVHCPCSNHKHQDARPSLELQPARNPRHGTYVLIGHAPGCLFTTEQGRIINAFDAYCRWYGLSTREALQRLFSNRSAQIK